VSDLARLRTDLVLVEQTYRGELSYIVKDPTTHKYFRFRPVEIAVMRAIQGAASAAEAAAKLTEDGIRVSSAAVAKFADKLKSMGLCERTLRERSVLQMERLRAQRRERLRQGPFQGELLRMRWSMGDPDRFMDRTMPYLRFCYSRPFLAVSVALFAIQALILALKWPEFVGTISDLIHFRASLGDIVILWATGFTIIAIHELAHGYTCKYYGGQVHEIGAMLFYFEPAFFCNVNDAWTFPELKARLWVTAAGSWAQMVVASVAAVVWWAATPGTVMYTIGVSAVMMGGLTSVLMNLNPLVPLDGYYALSDWLEVPNLRHRAMTHLVWAIKTRILRLDLPMPPADEREQRIFLVYGALAAAYILSIFIFIAGVVYGWLDQWLGAIGGVLFLVAVWLMARDAVLAWARTLREVWQERRAGVGRFWRSRRALAGAGLALIVLLGAVIRRPITVTGPYIVVPAARFAVVAPDSGVVFQLVADEGAVVEPGTPVVRIRNLALEREAAAASRAADSLAARETQARARGAEGEVARLAADRAVETARGDGLRRRLADLTLRAPVRGVILSARSDTLAGRRVSLGDTLLVLGRADSVEVSIALEGAGAPLVRRGQRTRLIGYADPSRQLTAVLGSVAASAPGGAIEGRTRLPATPAWRPGMSGEASVTVREASLWGALAWAVRRRIRSDLLL
jgi:putative peptide zinc metalloprotease protein